MFFYVFPGIASVASFTLATTNGVGAELGIPVFGSLFQIGWAFAIGIAFAIIVRRPTLHPSSLGFQFSESEETKQFLPGSPPK